MVALLNKMTEGEVNLLPVTYSNERKVGLGSEIILDLVACLDAFKAGVISPNGLEMMCPVELDKGGEFIQEKVKTQTVASLWVDEISKGFLSGESYSVLYEPLSDFCLPVRYSSLGMRAIRAPSPLVVIGWSLHERTMSGANYFNWSVRALVDNLRVVESGPVSFERPLNKSLVALSSLPVQEAFFAPASFFKMVKGQNFEEIVLRAPDFDLIALIYVFDGVVIEVVAMNFASFGNETERVSDSLGAIWATRPADVTLWQLLKNAMSAARNLYFLIRFDEDSFRIVIAVTMSKCSFFKEEGRSLKQWNISHVPIYLREASK